MHKINVRVRIALLTMLAGTVSFLAEAQTVNGIAAGARAINTATTELKTYFAPVVTLVYVIAAIIGVVGGFRIYNKWQNGDQDVQKAAVGWIGSILFLLAIAAILQAVFF